MACKSPSLLSYDLTMAKADPEYYNSVVAFDPEGNVAANYRKSHLYYADETWALQGAGFLGRRIGGLGNCAMGICKLFEVQEIVSGLSLICIGMDIK